MSIFSRLLPWWVPALVFVLLGAVILGQRVQVSNAKANVARAQKDLSDYRAAQAEAGRLAERARRTTEQSWTERYERTAADGQKKLDLVRGDADRAGRTADGVQRQLAALRAALGRATADTGPATAGAPTETAAGVCSDLLGRAAARAVIVERFADESHAAGDTCARASDELRVTQ